jgi:hypothetical protein
MSDSGGARSAIRFSLIFARTTFADRGRRETSCRFPPPWSVKEAAQQASGGVPLGGANALGV